MSSSPPTDSQKTSKSLYDSNPSSRVFMIHVWVQLVFSLIIMYDHIMDDLIIINGFDVHFHEPILYN